MKSTDAASLQNLNDIVLPATAGWWPLATGWYFLLGLLLLVLVWFSYQFLQRRINNRYRRAALRELQLLSENLQNAANKDVKLRQIPILLKRTALAAYPRNQVAPLSGKNWYNFLNSKLKTPLFTEATGNTLDTISYSTGDIGAIDSQDLTEQLLIASKHWLKHHQASTGRET